MPTPSITFQNLKAKSDAYVEFDAGFYGRRLSRPGSWLGLAEIRGMGLEMMSIRSRSI